MEDEGRLTVSSDFGNLLRRHRLAAGLSQEALAERARMSSAGISALERGHRRTPQRETLALLAGALALSADQRQEFEAAAPRPSLPRHGALVTVGPWPDDASVALPFALTSFVGRDAELAEILALVRAYRLVTITGAGGVGKTQTALRVAKALNSGDGVTVRFVGFAPIRDPSLLVAMIASALNVQEVLDRPLLAMVTAYLKSRTMLLIFDNCEHVITDAANVIGSLLSECPQVRVLATSRESLNTAGEYAYRLPSLDSSSAVMLFGDRARAQDGHFALTEDSIAIVAEICRRLDGIPLAIELAVARVTVLSLKTLAEKLDDRFRILTRGDRTALPRQQTMRATIEWSYDLLSPQEQRLFARLGIFAGGFSLDAVTEVCSSDGLREIDTFNLLTSLIDKSLVLADTRGDQGRYRLLESTAVYALEKQSAVGERERLARRHAEYFCEQAEAARERYGTCSPIAWREGVELELHNYQAALEWALTQKNDAVLGAVIVGVVARVWWAAGHAVQSRYWVELALPRVSEATHPAIAGHLQLLLSSFFNGRPACASAERAKRLFESAGDLRGMAQAQRDLGHALTLMGRLDEAREAIAQALSTSRRCGDTFNATAALRQLADLERERGDLVASRELCAQALAGCKALGDDVATSFVLGSLADLEFAVGDHENALRLVNEAFELASLARAQPIAAMWLVTSTTYRIALGDLVGARESGREGLRRARHINQQLNCVLALQHLALLAALTGNARCGAQLMGFVDAQYDKLEIGHEQVAQWSYDKLLSSLREALNQAEIEKLGAEGATWSEDRAIEEALKV